LYSANARVIGTNPNRIYPGQQLARSCARAAVPVAAARHASRAGRVWKVTYGYPYKCGDGDGDGYDTPCSAVFPRHYTTVTRSGRHVYSSARRSYSSSGYHGASGSYEACVIARESGGNSQVMNSSGHYGLYQFSASTWQAYGGSSADFGHASAAEQQRVFHNAIAQGGQSNWSPYDGC
jgi:hypothetical protein